MNPVVIDYEKCNKDGICADVCPRKLIGIDGQTSEPFPKAEAEALCIGCGHCLAVCPSGAISVRGNRPDDCSPMDRKLWPAFAQLDHLFKSRRSIRIYRDKPVARETIEQLLDTSRYAPSGSNMQPVHWIVVTGRERLSDLGQMVIDWMKQAVASKHPLAHRLPLASVIEGWENGEDRIFRGAPAVVITHAPEVGSLPLESCVIALTYFDLAAASMGLGTCWIGFLMLAANFHLPLKAALGIPQDHKLFGAMIVGYPEYSYQRIPPRNQTKVVWW